MQNDRVLVTSDARFIDSHLSNSLATDNDVILIDDQYLRTPTNLNDCLEFVQGSALDNDLPTDVGVIFISQRFIVPVTEGERTATALTEARREFDDWISWGSVSSLATDRPTIYIDSLENLIDVAVATETRVIEDADTGCYYRLTDADCYRYEPLPDIPA